MVGTSALTSMGACTKKPISAAKAKVAAAVPAVAGSMKASNTFCSRTRRARRTSRQPRERALESEMRILTAKSGGACLRPSAATSERVLSNWPYSDRQEPQLSRCREISCIATPLTAPSTYDENRARACMHFMTAPPVQLDQGHWRWFLERCRAQFDYLWHRYSSG